MITINNITLLEQFIYEADSTTTDQLRSLRFVQIKRHISNIYYYYDCLLAGIVLLNRDKVAFWKTQNLVSADFPFSSTTDLILKGLPSFQKKEWVTAMNNAEVICSHLQTLSKSNTDKSSITYLQSCIENIRYYFGLNQLSSLSSQASPITSVNEIITEEPMNEDINFYNNLVSPTLFQELIFPEKHTNPTYQLLEKIFAHFKILSKYKMQHTYVQVKNIDQYLTNHMKNIYFSQQFSMINIEKETISILEKINTYLTTEIDKYLEQCIDTQLSLIDSIHNKFKKVNQV